MRLDQALELKNGEKLIDCFSDVMIVLSISDVTEHGVVTVLDTIMNKRDYNYTDLYLPDLYEETDDEVYWIKWATKNRQLVLDNIKRGFQYSDMKSIYQIGFVDGFTYNRKIKAEEQLQK